MRKFDDVFRENECCKDKKLYAPIRNEKGKLLKSMDTTVIRLENEEGKWKCDSRVVKDEIEISFSAQAKHACIAYR